MLTITKLRGEPITLVDVAGPIDRVCATLSRLHREVDRLATQAGQDLHVVVDTQRLHEVRYSDVLLWLDSLRQSGAGSPIDLRIHYHVVADDDLIGLALRKANRQLGLSIAQYDQPETALTAIRCQLALPDAGHLFPFPTSPSLSTA